MRFITDMIKRENELSSQGIISIPSLSFKRGVYDIESFQHFCSHNRNKRGFNGGVRETHFLLRKMMSE